MEYDVKCLCEISIILRHKQKHKQNKNNKNTHLYT